MLGARVKSTDNVTEGSLTFNLVLKKLTFSK